MKVTRFHLILSVALHFFSRRAIGLYRCSLSTPGPLLSPLTCVRGVTPPATRLSSRNTSKSRTTVDSPPPSRLLDRLSSVAVLCLARPFLLPSLPRRAPRFSVQPDDNASPSDHDAVLPKIRKVSGPALRCYDNSSFWVPQKPTLQSTDPSPPRNR